MRFALLGPLEVHADGVALPIRAGRQRTIIALLLSRAGREVSRSSLVTEVWGDDPPPSAVPNLRTYVMRLRRLAPSLADRLTTSAYGYTLRVEHGELDVGAFTDAADAGRAALAAGDDHTAVAAYGRALRRGRPSHRGPRTGG